MSSVEQGVTVIKYSDVDRLDLGEVTVMELLKAEEKSISIVELDG